MPRRRERDRGRSGRAGAKPHTRVVTIQLTEADAEVLEDLAHRMDLDLVRLVRELAEARAVTARIQRREQIQQARAMQIVDELYR